MPDTSTLHANKVIFGGKTLIDLTGDSVTPEKLLAGTKAHDKSGATITGTCAFDVDSTDATVTEAEVLIGKTFYARGSKHTGAMPDNAGTKGTISTVDEKYQIAQGYHDGSGYAEIDPDEQAKIIPSNIRQGITLLGVTGTMSGTEDVQAETVDVTPSTTAQTITPSEGYNYLAQVNVKAIPYVETENAAGGITVTIG